MNNGYVKVFDGLKGFGFITREHGKDLFFHWTDVKSKFEGAGISAGVKVEFSVDPTIPHRAREVIILT